MAFVPIDNEDIEVGKPTKKSIFQRIKDNFDDHESRLDNLQEGASKIEVFNFEVFGYINDYTLAELSQIGTFEASADFSVTNVTLTLLNNTNFLSSSNTGSTSILLEKSLDNGITWFDIMTTSPSIPAGITSTGYKSTDGVINTAISNINQGDLLRVSVTSIKDVQGSFLISVYGEL